MLYTGDHSVSQGTGIVAQIPNTHAVCLINIYFFFGRYHLCSIICPLCHFLHPGINPLPHKLLFNRPPNFDS